MGYQQLCLYLYPIASNNNFDSIEIIKNNGETVIVDYANCVTLQPFRVSYSDYGLGSPVATVVPFLSSSSADLETSEFDNITVKIIQNGEAIWGINLGTNYTIAAPDVGNYDEGFSKSTTTRGVVINWSNPNTWVEPPKVYEIEKIQLPDGTILKLI